MTDEHFDAYLTQIITAARSDDARERVAVLLGEFQEKCYLTGRHALIDSIRAELSRADDRQTAPDQ